MKGDDVRTTVLGLGLSLALLAGCAGSATVERPPAAAMLEPVEAPSPEQVDGAPGTPWTYEGATGRRIVTDHFEIYTTIDAEWFVEQLPDFYEGCLHHYRTAFGELPAPPRRLASYIFGDSVQWQAKTRELLPDQAEDFMSLGRGGFTTGGTSVLYYIGRRDTLAIAAHEGWHQYTQRTFRHALPLWLEEGLASYMEAVRPLSSGATRLRGWENAERHYALRRAERRDQLIPLRELIQRSPQSFLNDGKGRLLVYYAQVWALTRFLVEGEEGRYRAALHEVIDDAAAGRLVGRVGSSPHVRSYGRRGLLDRTRNGPAVILAYFNDDLDELEQQYDRFVEQLVRSRRPAPIDASAE